MSQIDISDRKSLRRPTAIDGQDRARDRRCLIAAEVEDQVSYLLDRNQALGRLRGAMIRGLAKTWKSKGLF